MFCSLLTHPQASVRVKLVVDKRVRSRGGFLFNPAMNDAGYGITVPRGWSNLWLAGRAASADVQTHGVIRVQPVAAMMGQAAGTAAVQTIADDTTATDREPNGVSERSPPTAPTCPS